MTGTLIQYHKYVGTMFVSLCNYCDYAIRSMGMYFSGTAVSTPNATMGTYINIPNPQIKGLAILTDTLNWIMIRDTFISSGGELYLTIGNFSSATQSDTTYLGTRGFNGASYYYIDSVSVFDTGLIGVDEIKNKEAIVKIYPNPNNGSFNIDFNGKGKQLLVEVYNVYGQQVLSRIFEIENTTNTLQVEGLTDGVYLVKLIIDGIQNKSQKIIVNR